LSNSHTGATAVYQWWSSLLKCCIANKAYPWLLGHKPQLTTVDYIARCIVHIFRKKNAIGKKFHLTPLPEADVSLIDFFDRVNQYFGFDVEPLPYDGWLNRWKNKETDPLFPLLGMFSDNVYNGLRPKEVYQDTYYFSIGNTLSFMKDSGTLYPPLINKKVLEPYVKFLGELK
jgi:thioester reductase-like protein